MRRRITAMTVILLCVLSLLAGGGQIKVFAAGKSISNTFSGDVGLLKQDGSNYVMQVTVENNGEDFTGTVQVIFTGYNYDNCAYNTEVTLPAQGKKQFTITVPESALNTARGSCALNFLDGKDNLIQSIQLKNVFGNVLSGIPVGILSDNYSGLTFMDAAGWEFDIRGTSYPLQLIELDSNNLKGYLDGLYFLIIDQFNVSTLREEDIQAIQDWVREGGWLMIGTGAYAEQTLSGFDEDFLDINVINISEPGEENIVSVNADNYYYYSNYIGDNVDFTQMAVAELDYSNQQGYPYEDSENPSIDYSFGDGSVSVFMFSFGEKELQKLDDYGVYRMYANAMYQSNSYHTYYGASDMNYIGQRALAFIDSRNSDVDFTWLEVLIGVYVVLVGPVLYLVLRKCKKREWYWIGAPALGLLFIAGVFLFGRGTRVNETRAYSITTQRVDSKWEDTYFLAYHSGVKEWKMLLNDNYEVAGPGWGGYSYSYSYYGGSNADVNDYYYIVKNDSNGLSVGINPQSNFESGFLYAGGRTESKGSFEGEGIKLSGVYGNVNGIITNNTACDLDYMAVWHNSNIMVFSDVKAGETIDLQQAASDGRCVYQGNADDCSDLLYNMVSIYGYYSYPDYKQEDMAALLIGLGVARNEGPTNGDFAIVAGVVRDYEKSVADKCKETSYGCLYSYVEMEVGQNAAN